MRNINSPKQISRYIREVRENFSGLNGVHPNQYAGRNTGRYSNFISPAELQYSATGSVVSNPNQGTMMAANPGQSVSSAASLPIILTVANTTAGNLTATLFGAAANQNLTNFGNPTGISVTSGNTNINYQQVLSTTIATTFSCSYIRLINTGNTAQVQQAWTITSVNLEGQSVSTPIPNTASFSPFQQQSGILDLIYPLKIDALTTAAFVMLPSSNTMTIYFYPSSMVSPINTLVAGNPTTSYAAPTLPSVFSSSPVAAIGSGYSPNLNPGVLI
jgi:hypothetical protein